MRTRTCSVFLGSLITEDFLGGDRKKGSVKTKNPVKNVFSARAFLLYAS